MYCSILDFPNEPRIQPPGQDALERTIQICNTKPRGFIEIHPQTRRPEQKSDEWKNTSNVPREESFFFNFQL